MAEYGVERLGKIFSTLYNNVLGEAGLYKDSIVKELFKSQFSELPKTAARIAGHLATAIEQLDLIIPLCDDGVYKDTLNAYKKKMQDLMELYLSIARNKGLYDEKLLADDVKKWGFGKQTAIEPFFAMLQKTVNLVKIYS
ncbi:MAG: hypothetical protein NTW67_06090 [Candidatus Woesearchaeota archaeon]|nr:hypothetical protein [Candidatus Woesearchaeota archaeon]